MEVNWNDAPEWADRLSEYKGFNYWCGGVNFAEEKFYRMASRHAVLKFDGRVRVNEFKTIEMRPDNWKEGEKRMEQIAQNGNGGEVYEEAEDGKLSAYHRKVKGVWIDFYDIANAFDPENRNSADDHALKKMLLPGKRHTKGGIQDRKEAIQSIERAIELEGDK